MPLERRFSEVPPPLYVEVPDRSPLVAFGLITLGAVVLTASVWSAFRVSSEPAPVESIQPSKMMVQEIARQEAEKAAERMVTIVANEPLPAGEAPAPTVADSGESAVPAPSVASPSEGSSTNPLREADREANSNHWVSALTAYERAVDAQPNGVEGHLGMGRAYLELGRPEAAIYKFQRVVELSPSTAKADFWFGEAYAQLGRTEQALTHYRRYLDREPYGVLAQQASEAIAVIEEFKMPSQIPGDSLGTPPSPGSS